MYGYLICAVWLMCIMKIYFNNGSTHLHKNDTWDILLTCLHSKPFSMYFFRSSDSD